MEKEEMTPAMATVGELLFAKEEEVIAIDGLLLVLLAGGKGCAQKDQFTYYTRVYPFIDWIKKTMYANSVKDGA